MQPADLAPFLTATPFRPFILDEGDRRYVVPDPSWLTAGRMHCLVQLPGDPSTPLDNLRLVRLANIRDAYVYEGRIDIDLTQY